ncbi:fumarylacetoacetate hydrolase family protein [Ruegeria arenilitoris]|uniref:fumarylacetoacetate hydrolase family protein n=1 Tax=Ruegeria arenilitoris TaxID=1173585 RepID=UPI001480D6C6|nr:fumarylacetoacetate hydrolase family protein [Ruegeria arenilitoris]
MPEYSFPPHPQVSLPVLGSTAVFPVRRVYCVGRNYAAHAVEMGHDADREPPFFFQKNPDNLDPSGEFPYPSMSDDVHYEVELAVMLKSGGVNIAVEEAARHIFGYALAVDMTRRDLQRRQKELGRPWEVGKAFERSAPVGPIHPVSSVGLIADGAITLSLNGKLQQVGDVSQMIWKVPEIISYLSEYFELAAGDVILTGTPSGVGSVRKGDVIEVAAANLGTFDVKIV